MSTKPAISYLICATHRSGSTLLCEALRNTGLAGRPDEYFWRDNEINWSQVWGTASFADYLAYIFGEMTTPNGVFGAKIMGGHLPRFIRRLQTLPEANGLDGSPALTAVFPNLHFITITRRNKVRQAISLYRAVQTQQWAVYAPAAQPAFPAYNRAAISHWQQEILRQESGWQRFFNQYGVQPYTVVYEELVQAYETTARNILRFLGVMPADPIQFGPRHLRRQADELTDQWEHRFREKDREWRE